MTIHQIWIGDEIPQCEQACMQALGKAAAEAGHRHKVWSWDDLQSLEDTREGELLIGKLESLRPLFPHAQWAAMCSDVCRLLILARHDGMYLDTDVTIHDAPFPAMPEEPGVYFGAEWYNKNIGSNCAIYPCGCRGKSAIRRLCAAAEAKVLNTFDAPTVKELEEQVQNVRNRAWNVSTVVGPDFVREMCPSHKVFPERILMSTRGMSATHPEGLHHLNANSWVGVV